MSVFRRRAQTAPQSTPPAAPPAPLRPRLGPARRTVREVGVGLVTLGLVLFLFVAYQLWGTGFTERKDQSELAHQFQALQARSALATPATPGAGGGSNGQGGSGSRAHSPVVGTTGHPRAATDRAVSLSPPVGSAIDHLEIPSIGVDKYVVQGVAEQDLMEGPGHYPGTPMPGQRGNVGIAGHRTTYGAPFFLIGKLKPGAHIYLTDPAGRTFDYRVLRHLVVLPQDVGVLAPSHRALLTLTSCNPPYSATTRYVVVAALVGRPVSAQSATAPADPRTTAASTSTSTAPARRAGPSAAPASAQAGKGPAGRTGTVSSAAPTLRSLTSGDANALGPAIGFGLLAVLLWVAARILAARRRGWRKLGRLAAGVAVCAVPLWLCFQQVVRLLPPTV